MTTSPSKFSAIILAAGKGTRMFSDLPKVLHTIGAKSMLQHVIDTVQQLNTDHLYIVYGHGKALLEDAMQNQPVKLIYQAEQLGTGHAVQHVAADIKDDEDILILYGDTPLISKSTLQTLIKKKPQQGIALLTVILDDPTGYGRIERQDGKVIGIVEQKDASTEQQKIQEVNTGIMLVNGCLLKNWLSRLTNNNAQNEFYLTDIIAFASQDGYEIATAHPEQAYEVEGVNNRLQLATLERQYQKIQAQQLLLSGVTLRDPDRFDLRGLLTCGRDVTIDSNVIIEGDVQLGNHVYIGAGCILKNCRIDDYCQISPYSIIENSTLAAECTIGPFARIRPHSKLDKNVHVGNFVELKKAHLGTGTKAGHLSYLGDCKIGANVNIGAGSITCNYDGVNKFETVIDDNVFVGSDTQFIAPVKVGKNVTIAAGTTVTKNVNDNELVISRVKQKQITGWKRPQKINKED